jgi:hypothetical protein
MDVEGVALVHKGRNGDGGYVMIDDFANIGAAYSIGIGWDVSWDVAMAELGIDIWQYDHTVVTPPQTHPRFHFCPLGLAAVASGDGMLRTLESLILQNGHAGQRDLILKIDIEGAEWDVFAALRPDVLGQFSQIVVEFHDLRNMNEAHKICRVLQALSQLNASHQSVHVHANNNGSMATIGGITLPDVVEVTYVRRTDHTFVPCYRIFPTALDFPNNADRADIFLGVPGVI